jgi:energy-coupling factor transporter ATP-binding protein EcfA2
MKMNQSEEKPTLPNLKAAQQYLEHGFSVVPAKRQEKRPLVDWRIYQKEKADVKQLEEWFSNSPDLNIAIITGAISGIVVVDVEEGGRIDDLPESVYAKTGGGGHHFYYRWDPSRPIKNSTRIRELTDIRGEGGCVIAPPSIHKSGNAYEWGLAPWERELAEFPYWLLEKEKKSSEVATSEKTEWSTALSNPVPEGQRNDTAASIIGKLIHDLSPELYEQVAWPAAVNWNESCCKPPLSDTELRSVFESILEKHEESDDKENERKNQTEKILAMVMQSDAVLFRDQFNKAYIAPEGHGGVVLPVRSDEYRKKLSYAVYQFYGKPFGDSAVRSATTVLEGKALYDGEQNDLAIRVVKHGKEVWYDIGDGRVILINKKGWKILENPPILFKRFGHQKEQCLPTKGGSATDILHFFHIQGVNETGRLSGPALLAMIWIIGSFIPGFPHPILVLHGPNGSGKSTFFRYLKRLIDPSALEGIFMSKDPRELIQMASHHWFLPFDNVTTLKQEQSDMLCRFCTGEGASKRELYSDDNDVIYSFQVVMGLNGINLVVEKGDLLDRCILLPMNRIEDFEEEARIDARFRQLKPQILGSIFEIVSKSLEIIEEVTIPTRIRLADFARWGCAIAVAMGYTPEDFLCAYQENVKVQNQETLEASPIAKAILVFMENQDEWKGSPTKLHNELEDIADKQKINKRDRLWPKGAGWVWKRISEVQPSLQAVGIYSDRSKGNDRQILLWKNGKNSDGAVQADELPDQNEENLADTNDENPDTTELSTADVASQNTLKDRHSDSTDTKDSNARPLTEDQIDKVFGKDR